MKNVDTISKGARQSETSLAAESVAWQLGEIHAGIADLDAAKSVSHEKVSKWLNTWGKRGETKPPR